MKNCWQIHKSYCKHWGSTIITAIEQKESLVKGEHVLRWNRCFEVNIDFEIKLSLILANAFFFSMKKK